MNTVQTLLVGLAAGVIGTIVFTAIEYAEMALSKRPASMVPGRVAVALIGGDLDTDTDRVHKLNLPTHFAHGTMLGVVFGAIALLPINLVAVTALFYVALLGGDWLLYVALGVTAPPWRWGGADFTREVVLKAMFAIAVGLSFTAISAAF